MKTRRLTGVEENVSGGCLLLLLLLPLLLLLLVVLLLDIEKRPADRVFTS